MRIYKRYFNNSKHFDFSGKEEEIILKYVKNYEKSTDI